MKGQYRKTYNEKSEDVFKDIKKSIKNIDELSKFINSTSNDFLDLDMEVLDSIKAK